MKAGAFVPNTDSLDGRTTADGRDGWPVEARPVPPGRRRAPLRRRNLPADWDREVDLTVRTVPGPPGAPDLAQHLVTPRRIDGEVGALVYFHGGGFALGDAVGSVPLCAAYARDAGVVV